jgi:hypothetical protein
MLTGATALVKWCNGIRWRVQKLAAARLAMPRIPLTIDHVIIVLVLILALRWVR